MIGRGPSASVSLRFTTAEGPIEKRENSQFKLSGEKEPPQFGVRKMGQKTELSISSKGEYGWNYGTLKCDFLGEFLDQEVTN